MKNNKFTLRAIALFIIALQVNTFALAKTNVPAGQFPKASDSVPVKINSLVNTRLDVRFDYAKHYLYGKEWVTLKPGLYATDSLSLNARGMDIKEVSIVKNGLRAALKYGYDGSIIKIKLDKKYSTAQNYTVYISYTAKPDELGQKSNTRIADTKGLYFINTNNEDKNKPVQIWTQGEPEGSSIWFPTIDEPGQKTLQEISMTVPDKYVTLSNGRLVTQKAAGKGLRTDTWKMDKPHAPYLFMMAIGDFKIYKDKWKNTPVNYYLEEAFAPYAKEIFGKTPEMMGFYSKTLGIDYPWNKYSQVVVREYNSGAMENTTATLLGELTQKTAKELLDNEYDERESTIAHELFHQWFGDYVTCKNWANLTVNESMASFAETLWAEHKYGEDEGRSHIYRSMQIYLESKNLDTKSLIRNNYNDAQDVFDEVTYNKGACVLYMLRNYLGDKAFYKGLNKYLSTNAFNTGDVSKLQLAFEQASEKDLDWFFKQWYYRAGNPILKVSYKWDEALKTQSVYLEQTQKGDAFILPMFVDIYVNKVKQRQAVWMRYKTDTLTLKLASKPELVNVDGDRALLAKIADSKGPAEYVAQFYEAPTVIDRYEAINVLKNKQDSAVVAQIFISALKDPYYGMRITAIREINLQNANVKNKALPILKGIILHDKHNLVKAAALKKLALLKDTANYNLFLSQLNAPSYEVSGAALRGLSALDPDQAIKLAKPFEMDNKGALTIAMMDLYAYAGSEDQLPFVTKTLEESDLDKRFGFAKSCTILLAKVNNTQSVDQNVEMVKNLAIKYRKFGVDKYAIKWLTALKKKKEDQYTKVDDKLKEQLSAQVNFISSSVTEIQNAKD
jgi:aminopeptidase N